MEFRQLMDQIPNVFELQAALYEPLSNHHNSRGNVDGDGNHHSLRQPQPQPPPLYPTQVFVMSDMQDFNTNFPSTGSTSSTSSQMAATPPPPPLEFQVDDQELPNLEIQSCKVDDNFIPQVYRRQSSMIQKRRREPIFVTELPQNAYGKKKKRGNRGQPLTSLSPTILGEDEDEGATEEEISKMKNMSAKERRQLRNKISARNFRMRRKGYIEHLESRVSHQDKEIAALRATNTRLEDVNRQLVEELDQWRQWVESQQPTPPPPPPPPPQQPSLESANNTSPDLFPLLDMHEYTLCDFSTNLSHIAIPQLNFGQIFNEKSSKPLTPPSELMQSFPLLAPALMSMVLHHTMTSVVGQDFMGSMTPVCPKPTFPEAKALLVASDAKRKDDHVELEREHAVEQGQSSLDEWILKKHYVWYTWMRMRGYSHEQLVMRARACAGQSQECFVDRVHRKINVITAFCSVATTLLRHPDHAALMPAIVRNHPRLFNPNSQLMIDHAATCSTRLITSSTN